MITVIRNQQYKENSTYQSRATKSGLAIGRGRDGAARLNPAHLFFLIFKSVPFKKLNGTGRINGDGKILKPASFTFFLYFIFYIFIFIILKLIYFIKNKNIMNFYKLFI